MIDDGRAVPEGSVIRADLCIVGGGAAGIAMARALAGDFGDLGVVALDGWRLSRTEARAASLLHLERRA